MSNNPKKQSRMAKESFKICCYCGKSMRTTREHVVAKKWSKKGLNNERPVIVRACEACESYKGKLDATFVKEFSLRAEMRGNPSLQPIVDRYMEGLKHKAKERELNDTISRIKREYVGSVNGIHLPSPKEIYTYSVSKKDTMRQCILVKHHIVGLSNSLYKTALRVRSKDQLNHRISIHPLDSSKNDVSPYYVIFPQFKGTKIDIGKCGPVDHKFMEFLINPEEYEPFPSWETYDSKDWDYSRENADGTPIFAFQRKETPCKKVTSWLIQYFGQIQYIAIIYNYSLMSPSDIARIEKMSNSDYFRF